MFLFSACSGNPDRTQYISKDAVAVVKVNTMQLGKKIAWEKLVNGSLFKDNRKDTSFNIEKTGIDMLNVFYAYALADQRLTDKMKWMLIIPVKDATKWEAFIKEEFKEASVKKEGDINVVAKEGSVAGWKNNTAIIAFDPGNSGSESVAILTDEIKKAFALPKDQNIGSNKKFDELEKQSHDIAFFLNYELLMENLPQEQVGMAGGIIASQKKYLKDTYIGAGINFDKGKITADAQYFINPATMSLVKNLAPEKIDNEMLKRVPDGQLNGIFSYHFNPQGIKSLIDTLGYTGLANSQLQDMNLSVEEILNAFTGDFLLTAANLRMESKTATYSFGDEVTTQTYSAPNADWLFSAKTKDQAAVGKLLQLVLQMNLFTMKAPDIYESNGIILSVKNGYIAVSNSENIINAFLNNSTPNNWKIPAEVTGNPTGLYADIASSVKVIPADSSASAEEAALMKEGKNMLESMLAYGGKQKDDHLDFHFELNFVNKNENSLSQILDFVQKAKEADRNRKYPETEPAL